MRKKRRDYEARAQNLLKFWLSGTTCYSKKREIFWTSMSGRYVILRHCGHSEYLGRFSGTVRCGTYYCLYDLDVVECDGMNVTPCLKKWEGRWLKRYWEEVEEVVK